MGLTKAADGLDCHLVESLSASDVHMLFRNIPLFPNKILFRNSTYKIESSREVQQGLTHFLLAPGILEAPLPEPWHLIQFKIWRDDQNAGMKIH